MIEIGRALIAMRESCAALKGIGPAGTNVVWKLSTDSSSRSTDAPLVSVLTITLGPSNTNALVPVSISEEVRFKEVPKDARDFGLLLVDALTGRFHVVESTDYLITVGHTQRGRVVSDEAAGGRQTVTIQWQGRASWMPKA